jgi:2'-5' RNA ligase
MKRLFFGLEPFLPALELPSGRLLQEKDRHLTLVFLGNKEESQLIEYLEKHFRNPLTFSPLARCDEIIFLSSVAALKVDFLTQQPALEALKNSLTQAFFIEDNRRWLPHITLCKEPMDQRAWKELNFDIPCVFKAFHLYESLGHSTYKSLWSSPIPSIFQEITHTADYAFKIYGYSFMDLFVHAAFAICITFPMIFTLPQPRECSRLDDVIDHLNAWISQVDIIKGSPIKAVSYHAHLNNFNGVFVWEMILDV